MRFDIFLQGEVHKTDDVGAFIYNDETKAALEDAGYGRYEVWVWICALGLDRKSFLEPFWIERSTGKSEPGEGLQRQVSP